MTRRMAIGTLGAVVLLPAILWLGLVLTHIDSHAQELAPDDRETKTELEPFAVAPPQTGGRPGHATIYEPRREIVMFPVLDPRTGKTTLQQREQVVHVSTTRPGQNIPPRHGEQVMKLVRDLKKMQKSDDGYEKAIQELTEQLLNEFDRQHQQRGEEIENTAKRLETLKELHLQRESNKDRIVQRRIEQLLGEPDHLSWEPAPGDSIAAPTSQQSIRFPGQNVPPFIAGQPIRNSNRTEPQAVHPPAYQPDDARRATPRQTPNAPPRPSIVDRPVPADPAYAPTIQQRNEERQTRRIEVSSSGGGEVFQLARRLSSAALAESTAKADTERLKQLQKQGAVPLSEYRRQELKLEQAKLDLAFARAEWESLNERIDRELRSAKDRLALAEQQTQAVQAAVKMGEESTSELLKVQGMLEQIRKSLEDAQSQAKELSQAKTLIDEFDQGTNSEDEQP